MLTVEQLGQILDEALRARELRALERMFLELARAFGGFGATLWRLRWLDPRPTSRPVNVDLPSLEGLSDKVRIYVVGQGFEPPAEGEPPIRCAYDGLTLEHATGQAVLRGDYVSEDCAADPRVDKCSSFYRAAKPGSMLASRVRYEDGTWGAFTMYRRHKGGFPKEMRYEFGGIAQRAPALYAALLDRVSYRLVEYLSDTLDNAPLDTQVAQTLEPICMRIAEALNCVETSVFLNDLRELPDVVSLSATSCRKLINRTEYKFEDAGFTPHVLKTGIPLRIFDLRNVPSGIKAETGWSFEGIEQQTRDVLDLKTGEETPPVSFVAVPIFVGRRVQGVLRCRLRQATPFYFADAEVELLRILASRIGFFWARHLRLTETRSTAMSWTRFVDGLADLHSHTRHLAARAGGPSVNLAFQKDIFGTLLKALQSAVEGADILDIALPDPTGQFFQPIVCVGEEWDLPRGKQARRNTQLPVSPKTAQERNSWAKVFTSKESIFIPDTSNAPPEAHYRNLFPEARQALFVPIIADDQSIGVLSLRSRTFFRDEEKTERMASLVALVVALYHRLTTMLSAQSRTYQDLEHQLRTPVFQARKRARWVLDHHLDPQTDITYDLQAVNGLLARTNRVLRNLRVFEDLALERPVQPNRARVDLSFLLKLLNEVANDHTILWKGQGISFTVDRLSVERTKVTALRLDISLIEQVLNNIFDNAGKYGLRGSRVLVQASVDSDRRLRLTVKNEADLPLLREDLDCVGMRDFRSARARRRTAEGAGLGLYIAKKILLAHKGDLIAQETDPLGYTTITIALPIEEA